MTAAEILAYLKSQGVELWIDGDKLRYRGRKMTLPPQLLTMLRQHKHQLRQLLTNPAPASSEQFPLSHAQKPFWFLYQLNPASAAYVVSYTARLDGPLDLPALRRAFAELSNRHPVLRTRLTLLDGVPWQKVEGLSPCELTVVDATAWTEQELQARVQADSQRPFDLLEDAPARLQVYQRARPESVLLLSMPHIHVDGWSLAILVRELAALYLAAAAQQPASLPPVLSTYSDFVSWQQQRILSQAGEAQLKYWLEALAGPLPTLELPSDRPRPRTRSEVGATVPLQLSAELSGQLKAVALELGTTLYALLLAAFAVLLHRYSGQTDFIIGSPFHGRNEPRFARLVGCMINTLALRIRPTADAPFSVLLDEVSRTARAALGNADYPLQLLVERLQPERDTSRMPLFQVLFAHENFQDVEAVLSTLSQAEAATSGEPLFGMPMRSFPLDQQEGQFDLSLRTLEAGDRIIGGLVYNTDLFDRDTALRMAGHFTKLLQGLAAAPQQRIAELPLLTEGERRQVLGEWNASRLDTTEQGLAQLFAEQAQRTPEAVALVFEAQHLTYGELNARANQVAHWLCSLGVGPDVPVGLAVARSLDLVVGLLGILKAGGAYVPIELTAPAERIAFMLADSRPAAVVTGRAIAEQLPLPAVPCVHVDDRARLATYPETDPEPRSFAHHCAYAIYTSGSTGRPKGVRISQGAVQNLVRSLAEHCFAGPPMRVGWVAPVVFDASVQQIFPALLLGHSLHLVSHSTRRNGAALLEFLRTQEIELCDCTPSLLTLLVDAGLAGEKGLGLRTLLCGGEALPTALVAAIYAENNHAGLTVFNVYGPTECCVDSTIYRVRPARLAAEPAIVPIGRPLPNTQVYILDPQLQPVPVGVIGQLHIGGAGVARGYLNCPELTAEKFIPDPFSAQPGSAASRLYRTGDLGRFLPSGDIEFLGRIDDQVKLRGFRIELGEIEAVLAAHPSVRSCAVLLREDAPGDKRLVAYVVAPADPAVDGTALRQHLSAKLPDYMLPAHFVFLAALPQSISGKLDRKALPAPMDMPDSRNRSGQGRSAREAPRNPIEQILADIFAQLLRLPRVGIHENFFALGGHSLLATQAISRILSTLGVELPLAALFAAPTVAGLATAVAALQTSATTAEEAPIARVPREAPLPLSFAQQRLWFLDQLEPGRPIYNMLAAVRLRGPLDVPSLEQAISEIVRRHEALRTTFTSGDPNPVQRIHPPSACYRLARRQLTGAADAVEEELRRLIDEQVRQPFSLTQGPLFRPLLLKVAGDDHVLTLTMHHIISDGWSRSLLLHELGVLYAALRAGRPAALPELRIQVADISAWQRHGQHGERLRRSLAYWKEQLAGCRPLELPLDHPRPPAPSYRGQLLEFAIDSQVGSALKSLAQAHGATLFMTLLAAFQLLLSRYSGQPDIAVGSPIANRTRTEMEPLIGCFINTLVLRTQLDQELTFSQLLCRVRKSCLEAYAHQQVPFEQLVDELQATRDLSRNPLFQVMFVLQNTPAEELELPGLQSTTLTVHPGLAKFDLTLALEENPDGGLAAVFEYATDLFAPATIARMAGHYQRLLAAIAERPSTPIGELPLLSEQERQQLLVQWNDTRTDPAPSLCFAQLFAAQVAQTPAAPAVVYEDQSLSYRELDQRANQLAHRLRSLGVGPDVLVGLYLERSVEMLVGLLAVLKSGGAYVPLDPDYPQDRIRFLLADARPHVVLTQRSLLARLPQQTATTLCLDDAPESLPAGEHQDPAPTANFSNLANLAYVIYTSGSTGHPKGAAIEHRGLTNYLLWARNAYQPPLHGVVPVHTSPAFDLTITSLLLPLLCGAQLLLLPHRESVTGLLELLRRDVELALLKITPSHLRLLSQAHALTPLRARVRAFVIGGEALDWNLVEFCRAQSPQARIFNEYGPTETVVGCSLYEIRAPAQSGPVPIGRPIANTELYVLDERRQPVPIGVTGQIYIGGLGLARGYWNRPELTRDKFVGNPFSKEPGARLYQTGDLGRFRPDGDIEYLGRADHQVKLRGYRVELGEIEGVLAAHPDIASCAVVARRERPGEERLYAYVVPRPGRRPDTASLGAHLAAQLPDYMLPAGYVFLAALPETVNGKLDRAALPEPSPAPRAESFAPPQTPEEQLLAELFAQLVGVEHVGRNDNFFALGGHSLLAVRLFTQIAQRTGRTLPLSTLFQHPTIAALAAKLSERPVAPERAPEHTPVVPLQEAGQRPPLFCIHPVGGHVLCYAELGRALGCEQPLYGVQAGPVATAAPAAPETLEEVAAGYVAAIRKVQASGPYQLLGWSLGGVLAFEMARQLQRAGQAVALLALIDSQAPGQASAEPHEEVSEESLLAWFLHDFVRQQGSPQQPVLAGAEFRELPSALAYLRRRAMLPPDTDEAQLRSMYALFRRNLGLLHGYRPGPYPGPVLLLRAAGSAEDSAADHGWTALCAGALDIAEGPGDHYTILSRDTVGAVARVLSPRLAAAAEPAPPEEPLRSEKPQT